MKSTTILLTKIKSLYSKLPKRVWITGGLVTAVLISYSFIFFIPKDVTFSYAEKTCVSQLTLAPNLQKASSDDFSVQFENDIMIGGARVASTKVCFEPTTPLKQGQSVAAVAPFGGVIAQKHFNVQIPSAPAAKASDIVGKTISTAQPLKVQLSSADVVHQYSLKTSDKTTSCKQDSSLLSCDIAALDLAHGTTYTVALHQTYKQTDNKLVEGTIETLQPIVVTNAPVTNGQTLYDAPTSFTFTFDRTIVEGDISLVKVVGDATEAIPTTFSHEGQTATVTFGALARESQYKVNLTDIIADNGSSLSGPISIPFATSGGPKVTSVSVGGTSVARNATIIVSFDQPIDASVDINKLVHLEGVDGTISKRSDTQLAFAIKGGDCTPFALIVDKGIKSGSNGELSKDAWRFNARTICGSSWTIGTSLQGRAITAYSFGSGSKTILFTGGIHGSEPSGYTTMQAWVQYLQANAGDVIPAGKRVVIVPNTNPDAIAKNSRNNSRNVNVDRNFPTANWSASIETTSGTLPTGGGTSPGSEPEAAALISLTRQLRPRLSVSFHAQGRLVGANKFSDSVAIGDIYASTVGYRTMFYNAEAVMGYPMTGELEDWMGEEMNIPAILIELPAASGNYLNAQLPALKKMLAV